MIDLKTTLSHLPADKIKELEKITQQIVDTQKAELVVLFGSYARGNYKEKRGETQGKKSDYDILVAVSDNNAKKALSTALRETFTGAPVTVQLVIETITLINHSLEEKQFFFTDIKRQGKTLYSSGKVALEEPGDPEPTRRREIAEADFQMWFKQAEGFYKQYEHALSDKAFSIASFNLQQTVEMCYTAIEMVFTHYNPYEHNLWVLRNRVLQFDSRVKEVLPYETERQQDLFDHLNYAYIGGRYHNQEEFPVTRGQLDYWSQETKKLLQLTASICQERIAVLKDIEAKGLPKIME